MNIRFFLPEDYPSIALIHNSLNIIWPEAPISADAWAETDHNRNPKCHHQRWVSIVDGRVIGYASYGQSMDDYHPQRFYINVEVLKDYQRCGIGSVLYDQVMDGLQRYNPRVFRADAFTNLPQGFRFLQKRGFYEAFRETPVHLDVASFDPSPYAGLEAELSTQGVVIKTVRELESDPGRNRKIYDLYHEIENDLPREGGEIEYPDFEEWVKWALYDPTILPDAYFIAVFGKEYIGLRELGRNPGSNMLLGGLLGVRREFRMRGIGLAMQLRGIAYAREHGYRQLKTCTAIQNAPMQALFDKLGYTRDPEWLQCQKDL